MSNRPPILLPAANPVIRFGRCELRLDTRELLLGGQRQAIRRRVFDLIVYLIHQRPRAVPHHEALRAVWQRGDTSASVLARAVMEARRACGDPADEPRLFASVHGVGYRFAGALLEGPAEPETGSPAGLEGVAEVRSLLAKAGAAFDAGRLEEAQFLAERALTQAGVAQSQSERVHALVLCSSLAMRRGTAAAAAKLAAQALQIARGEGHAALVAQARVAVGYVHLVAGDRSLAIRHFQESREALTAPGYERDLVRMMTRLSLAFRELGNLEAGLKICRGNLELSRQFGDAHNVLVERNNEVMFLLMLGDQQQARQQLAQAQANFEEGLELVDALLRDMAGAGPVPQRQSALGNRAFLLDKLGRSAEAWAAMAEFEQELDLPRLASSPVYAERLQVYRMLRTGLLAGSGRHEESLQEMRANLEAAEASGLKTWMPRLYGQASNLAQRAGRLDQALDWARRQMDAQTALQASQAESLARILEAELNTDELQSELDRAREQVTALLKENAELRSHASLLQGAVPLLPETGLAAAGHLAAVFSAPHQHARARGLPMCVGLLQLVNEAALAVAHAPEVMDALFKRAASVLGAQGDIAHPAVAVDEGRVAFHIRDAGPTRAAEVCAAVLRQLRRQDWVLIAHDLDPQWSCQAADAALMASPEDCVRSLLARG